MKGEKRNHEKIMLAPETAAVEFFSLGRSQA